MVLTLFVPSNPLEVSYYRYHVLGFNEMRVEAKKNISLFMVNSRRRSFNDVVSFDGTSQFFLAHLKRLAASGVNRSSASCKYSISEGNSMKTVLSWNRTDF